MKNKWRVSDSDTQPSALEDYQDFSYQFIIKIVNN